MLSIRWRSGTVGIRCFCGFNRLDIANRGNIIHAQPTDRRQTQGRAIEINAKVKTQQVQLDPFFKTDGKTKQPQKIGLNTLTTG
jgi:hypothetical protein